MDVISHMVNSEDNMTNLNNAETGVTIGDSRTFTGKNVVIGTSIINVTENSIILTLSDTAVIPGLHSNLFSVTRALKKGFQVISLGEALILK